MTVPASYDAVSMAVSPGDLSETYKTVFALANDTTDQLNAIMTALQGLQLSWTGDSAADMQDFTSRWNTAARTLFGTDKTPGAVNLLLAGISSAMQNYDVAETWVQTNFGNIAASLNAPPSSGALSLQDVLSLGEDPPTSFINETFFAS